MIKHGIPTLAALAVAALAPLSAHAKILGHINANGAYASAYSYSDTSDNRYTSLSVNQYTANRVGQTWLDYYSGGCDWVSSVCTGVSAYGVIPNKSFDASAKSASLSVNTTGLPEFYAFQWTYDLNTWSYTETPINLGNISVNWKTTGTYSQKTVGTSTSTYLNVTWKTTGQSSGSEAAATGNVGGEYLNASYGSIGTNSNNDRTIERK